MQKSKLGLVLFNDKFEDGSLPFPLIQYTTYPLPINPQPPLPPPLKNGKVLFFSLLCERSVKMRLHLNSFIKTPKRKVKVKSLSSSSSNKVKSINKEDRKQNGLLQKKILACKNPEEIETLLIQEGVLNSA